MKANYQTSLSMNEEDRAKKKKLEAKKISVIDTWRKGAEVLLKKS